MGLLKPPTHITKIYFLSESLIVWCYRCEPKDRYISLLILIRKSGEA